MLKNSGYGYSDYGMFNSTWTCIGPTSRLGLINNLTIVYYLQCVKVVTVSVCQHTCVHAFACVRACLSIIACG